MKNKSAAPAAAKKRRPAAARTTRTGARRSARTTNGVANFVVPLFFIFCILFCLGFLGFMGYRTVTASEFFGVKKIEVRGLERASRGDIEKIVANLANGPGVWNADLKEIKDRVEKLAFVKSAAVSRVLPDGVRVNLVEREPRAIVRLQAGDYWVDEEGVILAMVGANEQRFPFVMLGWEENAVKTNQDRIKVYQKMLEDWRQFDLDKRVQSVDLSDLKTPLVHTQDSGQAVKITLAREDFAKKLKSGLEGIAGRGQDFAGIDVRNASPLLIPRERAKN